MSKETIKRSLFRALEAMIVGALTAFVAIPIDLENPKKYFLALGVGVAIGAIMGLKKAITGYLRYDVKN